MGHFYTLTYLKYRSNMTFSKGKCVVLTYKLILCLTVIYCKYLGQCWGKRKMYLKDEANG